MASTLETLVVRLTADATKLEQELNRQVRNAETAGAKIRAGLRLGAHAFAVLGTAAVGTGTALTVLVNRTAAYADEVDKAAIRTRLARSTVQELRFVADQAGGSFQAIEQNIRAFTGRIAEAERGSQTLAGTFDRLGVSLKDNQGNLRDTEDLFLDTLNALSGVENETERAALAVSAFGETASDLLPIISQGAGGIDDLREKARELGLVLDDQRIGALVQYKDAVSRIGQGFEAVRRDIAIGFLPILKDGVVPVLENFLIPRLRDAVTDLFGLETAFDNSGAATEEFRGKLADIAASVVTFGDILLDLGRIALGVAELLTAPFAALGSLIGGLSVDLGRFAQAYDDAVSNVPAWQRGTSIGAITLLRNLAPAFRETIGASFTESFNAGLDQYLSALDSLGAGFSGLVDLSPGEAARQAVLNGSLTGGGARNTPNRYNATNNTGGAGGPDAVALTNPAFARINPFGPIFQQYRDYLDEELEREIARFQGGLLGPNVRRRRLSLSPFATVNGAVPLGDPGVRATFGGVTDLRGFTPRATVGGAVRLDDPGAFARLLLGDAELQERDLGRLAQAQKEANEAAAEAARLAIAAEEAWRNSVLFARGQDARFGTPEARDAYTRQAMIKSGLPVPTRLEDLTPEQRALGASYRGFTPRQDNPADLAEAQRILDERERAEQRFAETVAGAAFSFTENLIGAIRSGDIGEAFRAALGAGQSILGSASLGSLPFLGGSLEIGALLSGVLGIFAALIPRGAGESEATRALGASTRGAPAVELNFTVNQSLNIASLTGSDRRAVDGLLNDTVRALDGVITRNILPRLGYLEERIA